MKSQRCNASNCVEVYGTSENVLLRDSQRPEHILEVSREDWDIFVAGVQNGEFNEV